MVLFFENLHVDLNAVVKRVQPIIADTKIVARNIARAAGDKLTSAKNDVVSAFAPQAYAFAA